MEEEAPVPFKDYFPNLSMSSYFWLIMGLTALLFAFLGYFVGIRVSQLPSSSAPTPVPQQPAYNPQMYQPTQPTGSPIPGDDNDVDYSSIDGVFTTNTSYYDQLVVNIDSLQNSVRTNLDTDYRDITKPQVGVQYPFGFDRLDPYKSYIVSASACTTNPKTYALECAKNIKITKCSGQIQGQSCIITGNGNEIQSSGEVNFSIPK